MRPPTKEDGGAFGGHAYDAILIVTEGAQEGRDRPIVDKVRDAIENLHGLVGTAASTIFRTDHTGLDLTAFEMLTVKDGTSTTMKKQPGLVAAERSSKARRETDRALGRKD